MKSPLRFLSLGFAATLLALASFAAASPAYSAAALVSRFSDSSPQSEKVIGFGDVTAAYTNATTSYTDLAGSNVTYVPSRNDCTTAARIAACLIEVNWSADVSKATATTGTCAVYANGAVIAASARSVASAAGQATIGGLYMVANSVVGSQTLKLQCKSGDTNTFTVNNAHVVYREIIPPASH